MPPRPPHGRTLCLACGSADSHAGLCASCGAAELATLADGAVVGLPAGYRRCERCDADDRPLVFRGSIRLYSVILIARESRVAGYVCLDCARRRTAGSLAFTGLLGWWGLVSALVWAPRATYHNWRAVSTYPRRPLAWGALAADALAAAVRPAYEERWSGFGDVGEAVR